MASDIKNKIVQIVDSLPDNVLQDLLDYLQTLECVKDEEVKASVNLRTILSEDKELLQELAK